LRLPADSCEIVQGRFDDRVLDLAGDFPISGSLSFASTAMVRLDDGLPRARSNSTSETMSSSGSQTSFFPREAG
jgi:hypothetical protein